MCLCLFGLYCSACLGSLYLSIFCMCCSHSSWYCFISLTIFSAPVFSQIHWFFSLSSFVIPRRCLKFSSDILTSYLNYQTTLRYIRLHHITLHYVKLQPYALHRFNVCLKTVEYETSHRYT
jgi:hypothetical protein